MDDEADRAAKKAKLNDIAMKQVMPNFVQPSMKDITEKRLVWSDDNAIAQRIDKTIMDVIIVDMLPYTVVEGEAFKRLNFADPISTHHYTVKSEKFFRTTLMPATYDKVVEHVKKLLLQAEYISFTTDGWSSPTKSCSLLSFTGHFLHGAVCRKIILSAMVLDDDHTAAYLSN